MASEKISRRRGSTSVLALPENEERRVSLTGFSNIVIDESLQKENEDDQSKLRCL